MAATGYANSWGLDRIDQRALPLSGTYTPNPGVGGGGVDVYVIDTGLATQHPEFQGRVGNGYDFVDGDSVPQECGNIPHGTHVAGTIASTLFGVAPQSTIHGVRVLDCDGDGYVSDIIAGMNWVVGERARIGHTVVANMSLGGTLQQRAQRGDREHGAQRSGHGRRGRQRGRQCVVLLARARPRRRSPLRPRRPMTPTPSYSNYGSIIDLYAPGSDIWSTYAYDPAYKLRLSGTSMAAPHVAGWAALYLGLHQDATPAQVTSALLSSGTKGMIIGEVGGTPDILPFVGDLAAAAPSSPAARATLRVAHRTSLSVNVDPNRPARGYWRIKGQQKQGARWVTRWTATTQGAGETLVRDVRRGTWRIVVPAQYGYRQGVSSAAWVTR